MLSIDMRVQHAMREELLAAIERFKAIAGAGVMVDIRTGEVIAMVSLPEFDPNFPVTALEKESFNRITNGTFELGSTLKSMTIAAALDSGAVDLTEMIDAREGVRFGRFVLDHGKHLIMSVSDVFRWSDNIGTIRIMQAMGKDRLRAFLGVAGFDARSEIELPERAMPQVPAELSEVGAATASYGYGFASTPMHMTTAVAALMNAGQLVPPTLFKRSVVEAQAISRAVVSDECGDDLPLPDECAARLRKAYGRGGDGIPRRRQDRHRREGRGRKLLQDQEHHRLHVRLSAGSAAICHADYAGRAAS